MDVTKSHYKNHARKTAQLLRKNPGYIFGYLSDYQSSNCKAVTVKKLLRTSFCPLPRFGRTLHFVSISTD